MKFYRITATLLAPLAIQKTRQSNASETLSYLPGSSFRGAAAAKYLQEGGSPEDDDFQLLFIRRPIFFPNLLPVDDDGHTISQVLPLTSISCKRFPGFKGNDSHGVCDTLAKKWIDRNNPEEFSDWQCPLCGEAVKAISGYWNGDISAPVKFKPTALYQRHTGIDRVTGTIAQGIFYITQTMADYRKKYSNDGSDTDKYCRQVLSGGLFMDEKQYVILKSLVTDSLIAGADRTSGMGELNIVIEPSNAASPDIVTWDQSFKTRLQSLTNGGLRPDLLSGVYFTLKLESHGIFVDEFLRPTAELNLDFLGIKPVFKMSKSLIIRGWNDAWRMPKPDDIGIRMGSVYLFCYEGDDLEGLGRFLAQLNIRGIGLRREEGFGRVFVCDPFHIQKEVI